MTDAAREIEEWVVHMSAAAWRVAKGLEAQCACSGLDSYMQAQIHLMAAKTPNDKRLWQDVWRYIQTREAAGWNDRVLIVLEG